MWPSNDILLWELKMYWYKMTLAYLIPKSSFYKDSSGTI